MNKTMVLMSLLLSLCLLMIVGCKEDETRAPADGTENPELEDFYPEYDYVAGYDISSYFNGVKGTFEECNTNFWPYQDEDSEILDDNLPSFGYIADAVEMQEFVAEHADCMCGDGPYCEWLNHKLYLAAVKKWTGGTEYLGLTIFNGEEGWAICMIFVEECQEYVASGYSTDQIIEGTLLHELGHGRADLTHFCSGSMIDYNNHSGNTCLMVNAFPKFSCTDVSPLDGHYPYSFCDKCIDNLKAVTW